MGPSKALTLTFVRGNDLDTLWATRGPETDLLGGAGRESWQGRHSDAQNVGDLGESPQLGGDVQGLGGRPLGVGAGRAWAASMRPRGRGGAKALEGPWLRAAPRLSWAGGGRPRP